jgi:hypothetical protein
MSCLKKEKEQVFTLPVIVELNEYCVRHIACILSTLFLKISRELLEEE